MTDLTKLETDRERGARAAALLESDLLKEAFDGLEASYILAWRTSPATDTEGREKLFLAINVIGKVRDHLSSVATNGHLATEELRRFDEARKDATAKA